MDWMGKLSQLQVSMDIHTCTAKMNLSFQQSKLLFLLPNSLFPIYMDLWIINSSAIELLTPASLSQCQYHNNFVCNSFQWIITENLY